ncbi:apolipoprotein N-acyltransferase [Streptomyces sp. HNM0663]|uniref:Apolipoprotein N-acyltransferase n=1 Tax=Streptomyces chengmaiensis TaxID=3040919 RepID=A0ABT6HQK5_9ACTN|nr:apolipoprotein N-acyltransferase [Streptomyces chengmaiensis]MDH2390139.1 apolipoprotein N-acyltransferase [Streptomyces chengmaiensis]
MRIPAEGRGDPPGPASGPVPGPASGPSPGPDAGPDAGPGEGPPGRLNRLLTSRLSTAPPLARDGAALVAGALPVLAFPEPSLWWLACVALTPWLLILRTAPSGRRAALEGWLGGVGFVVAMHHWLAPNLHVFIVVLGALLGVLWAPWGWLVRALLGGAPSAARGAAAVLAVPSGWLLIELARSWEGLGGPWGLLGASQWQVEPALALASVGSVWLVSLLIVAVNTALVLLLTARAARLPALAGLLVIALAVPAAWLWAPRPDPSGRVRVAVVQPGVVNGLSSIERRFDRSEELTRGLAARDLDMDLVVWGESSVGADLGRRPDLAGRLAALSREADAPLLVNVDARRGDRPGIFKSSVPVGPEGPAGDRYDKMRLVPFGEYVPARALLGWVTSMGEAADEDRRRGTRPVVMELPGDGLRIGPLICFETAFPDMSRRLARNGAQLLVAQSATSTFQGSWAPEQHASLAALRAAETGRPMVHATLTGASAVYDAEGERIGRVLGTEESTAAVYEIPLAEGSTLYVRFGDWPVYGALAVLAALSAAAGARTFRSSARGRGARRVRTARGSSGHPRD